MSLTNWIANQSSGIKLLMGLAVGILLWALLRYFIYIANKHSKEMQENKKSKRVDWKGNLKSMANEQGLRG